METILEVISAILGPLLGNLIEHKTKGRKVQWGNGFRLFGVGFTVVGLIIAVLFFADKDINPSGACVCAGPFLLIGATLLVIGILQKHNPWK